MSLQTQQTRTPTAEQAGILAETARAEEDIYRAGAYNLLASLLRAPPAPQLLAHVAQLSVVNKHGDELALTMNMLGLAAQETSPEQIDDEFHALFIGIGRGELVPYGSWYMTGFLQEKPLALLRDDLAQMGFERQDATHEPEDHVAALCEVMAMLINDDATLHVQNRFYAAHIGPWLNRFFTDLSQAKNAVFYRAVGRFGNAFIDFEQNYLTMKN
jgi:TorA maturation chaperone TorD